MTVKGGHKSSGKPKGSRGGLKKSAYGNPSGLTISGAKSLYANQLAEGATLQQAMASNPAETTYFGALIDDTPKDTVSDVIAEIETKSNNDNTLPHHDLSLQKVYVDGPLQEEEVEVEDSPDPEIIYRDSPYGGPSLQDFEEMLKKMFSNPWTPYGYGWGGSNTKGAKMNRSLASRGSSAYKGMSSSFGRSGDRLSNSNLSGPQFNI